MSSDSRLRHGLQPGPALTIKNAAERREETDRERWGKMGTRASENCLALTLVREWDFNYKIESTMNRRVKQFRMVGGSNEHRMEGPIPLAP